MTKFFLKLNLYFFGYNHKLVLLIHNMSEMTSKEIYSILNHIKQLEKCGFRTELKLFQSDIAKIETELLLHKLKNQKQCQKSQL